MRPILFRSLGVFLVLAPFAQTTAKEPVRTELIRLQKDTGLTLASFYRSLETVLFADRSMSAGKEVLAAMAGDGAITRDGMDVAVNLFPHGFGVVHNDGSDFRGYSEVSAAYELCWSYDKSKLAMNVQNLKRGTTPPNDNLQIFNLSSKEIQVFDVRAAVTSQCWSPDNKKVVYDADDHVRAYDSEQKQWLELAKGHDATWSPDGNWIAFLDDDTYYAISPSGENRRELFKSKGALSGLWWSPDSRIVAYISRNKTFEGPMALDVGMARLRVRRLSDSSEDWVAQVSDAHIPAYQWVQTPINAERP